VTIISKKGENQTVFAENSLGKKRFADTAFHYGHNCGGKLVVSP
jgi:hypothetical protein